MVRNDHPHRLLLPSLTLIFFFILCLSFVFILAFFFLSFFTRLFFLSLLTVHVSLCHSTGSGQLEFEEFLALCARFLVEEDAEAMQEELREAFRLYDKEGNGYIKTTDLREILRALDDKLTEDELDEMIAEIDTDGSGTVDFDGN